STETRGCRPWAPGAEVIETEIWGLSLPLDSDFRSSASAPDERLDQRRCFRERHSPNIHAAGVLQPHRVASGRRQWGRMRTEVHTCSRDIQVVGDFQVPWTRIITG